MIDPAAIAHMTRNEADMAFRRRVATVFEWIDMSEERAILDCGCGRGFYLDMISSVARCRLVGIEQDAEIITKANALLADRDGVTLVRGSLDRLPFHDGAFDGAIASEVLEHVEDDVGALREIARVLKPGGSVALTVPNADYPFLWDPINRTRERLGFGPVRTGTFAGIWANHVRLYTAEELRRVVLAADLEIRAERAFTHHAFPFIHNIVYGFGKPLLESGLMPRALADAADRTAFRKRDAGLFNPVRLAIGLLALFDRPNRMDEPPGRSTVNLCLLARKPAGVAP
ncbi:MAG: class I SAM-dependent methyltransferase [Parvibaculaceae bacterium]